MMSQPFSRGSGGRLPSQDFIMMNNNNNYLPGVSLLSESVQLPGPQSGQRTSVQMLPNPLTEQNYQLDANRISSNIGPFDARLNVVGNGLNVGGAGVWPVGSPDVDMFSSSGAAEVEMNAPDLCEHQGSVTAQNLNISLNSDWNSAPYTVAHNQNFTFTTPTQSSLYSPALMATTQNRFLNARLRPQTFAPGCNAQWKHSVPRRVPVLRQRSVSSPLGLSVFTGTQSSSVCSVSRLDNAMTGTSTFYSPQMNQPVPSCSEFVRRPKRRHTLDMLEDDCPGNKIHLTEDKIASHMKDLNINNFSPPQRGSTLTGQQFVDTGQKWIDPTLDTGQGGVEMMAESGQGGLESMSDTCYPGQTQQNGCKNDLLHHSHRQWHDFKLLEEKLQMIDEDSSSESEDSNKSQPVLRIVDGIEVAQKPLLLPEEILSKIRNPCQDVVLWTPQVIQINKEDETADATEDVCESGDMMDSSILGNMSSSEERRVDVEDNGMETEPEDEIL